MKSLLINLAEHGRKSLPSRERGLKLRPSTDSASACQVAPFAGAWIEILHIGTIGEKDVLVAPFAGAWIEITTSRILWRTIIVAPFAGAWIEIVSPMPYCPAC